nr:signal recognition particle subunit SRP68-like isoform X2 [Physcomitrium patens]|eukprot:XP_024397376.1 signal recognition particle subunit SRP68-like isoform X2 [Physcomitrella patens]
MLLPPSPSLHSSCLVSSFAIGFVSSSVVISSTTDLTMDTSTEDVAMVDAALPSIGVLQLIKGAQAQHGLRHGDYQRYRRYCTARLARLYKSLNFTHGKGKYVKKPITEATVTNVRYLHIVLYLAERAWSYAMELKQATGTGSSRKRIHLIRRLAKAARWGELFSQLCTSKADSRTALEAAAYAAYMKGNLLLEREDDWDVALKNFKNARAVYEELGKYGDVENQVLCRQRVEELDPSIRYCNYKMGNVNIQGSDLLDLRNQEGPGLDLLQSKLQAVIEEARSKQAVTITQLEWLEYKLPVNNEKTRLCIVKGQELEKDTVESSSDSLTTEKKLAVYDKIFVAYQDAKRHIRDDLVRAVSTEDVKEELTLLDKAVSSILLQRTIDRNLVLVAGAKARLTKQQQGSREEKGEKPAKPEDLVRLYDILYQNVSDLIDLTTSGREQKASEVAFAKELEVRREAFQAERCFYLAQFYSVASKFPEAYLLFKRSEQRADSAAKKLTFDKSLRQEAQQLKERSRGEASLVHARAVADDSKVHESLQKGVASMKLKEQTSNEVQFLVDNLEKFEAFVGASGSKDPPRIAQIPPPFQSVPCRPIVLDTALTTLEFPSLQGRLKKLEKKSSSFFGLWNRGK